MIPFLIFLSFLLLAIKVDIASAIPEIIGISAFIVILLTILQLSSNHSYTNTKHPSTKHSRIKHLSIREFSAGFILVFAILLRLMFLFHTPTLSDDIYRYCLDGVMLINGNNPYSYSPLEILEDMKKTESFVNSSIVLGNLDAIKNIYPTTSKLLPLVNHPELTTIYPPAAQIIFGIGGFIDCALNTTTNFIGIKIVLIIMDTLSCLFIIQILKKMKLSVCHATIYAWHPLPVLEIAASGHIDGAAIFFMLMAIYLAIHSGTTKENSWNGLMLGKIFSVRFSRILMVILSGVFIGLSILTKWIPLMFLPCWLFLIQSNRREIVNINDIAKSKKSAIFPAMASCAVFMAMLIIPFCPDMVNSLGTLNKYLQNWEFSGFVFRMLRQMTCSGEASRLIIVLIFVFTTAMIVLNLYKEEKLQRQKCSESNGLQATMNAFFMFALVFLVLTPTLYPWYALYLVALLPFTLNRAGITLSWSVLLSYKVLILYKLTGYWVEDTTTLLMIIVAPVTAFVLQPLLNYLQTLISIIQREHLEP
ncbi:MAG: hypothetical protein HQK73_09850 [Desulfamplus sp.]|nr:hypothetical protein [Desulfamplus sp.]